MSECAPSPPSRLPSPSPTFGACTYITVSAHDVLFDEPEDSATANTAPPPSEPQPTLNGEREPSESFAPPAPPMELPKDVSSGIDPVQPFLPDSQTDALFDPPELGDGSLLNAAEAPMSDVREESAPEAPTTQESTQRVLETQPPVSVEDAVDAKPIDAMDITVDAPTATQGVTGTDGAPTRPMKELTLEAHANPASLSQHSTPPANVDQEMEDVPSGKVRSREEDDDDEVREVKRTKTELSEEASTQGEFKVPEIPSHTEQTNGNGVSQASDEASSSQIEVQSAVGAEEWPTSSMTVSQNKFLLERVRNTKKIKVAQSFKDPVDPIALNIPTYTDFVTTPMDLSTMENKLKENGYVSVREFMEDFDQIIDNSVVFNGKDHPVTQAGYSMRAYFIKGMLKMPRVGLAEPMPKAKPKKAVAIPPTKARRESRVAPTAKSPTAPTPTAASPQTAWPLNPVDGMPLIRRDSTSTSDRPKREIHRPPPKDLPYSKPRRKKFQHELKFCEMVLGELKKQKHQLFAFPFMTPVDPVALNIPSYFTIIKKPMDFGTIEKNLKAGNYQTAKEFYNDAQLVFQNCYKFNPEGDAVNAMGKQLNEVFDKLWSEKAEWLVIHAPTSDPQSPGSAYSDEEEEEEEGVDPAQAQILAIQQQIAQLNETAQSLLQQQQKGKHASPKAPGKKKSTKPPASKKKAPLTVPPPPKSAKSKARTKALAPLSFLQKQEISEGISTLGDADMRRAVQIIRNGCPQLAGVNDDEMEIDMDEIGDDTLRELFKFIKQVRGPRGAIADDDDFEPARPAKAQPSKPKKNKPMGKKEQEENIKKIQEQLKHFDQNASGSSESPPGKMLTYCSVDLKLTSLQPTKTSPVKTNQLAQRAKRSDLTTVLRITTCCGSASRVHLRSYLSSRLMSSSVSGPDLL
jgi:bromodomain-containing factor 1